MAVSRQDLVSTRATTRRLTRRRVLQQGGTGLAAALAAGQTRARAQQATPAGESNATPVGSDDALLADLSRFDADVEAAMETFDMVGAAVALVDLSGIRYQRSFGVRDLISRAPVTPDTHFFVASTTKSMSSLLVATFVDDGVFAWDQPVREVWPDFQAPTAELTDTLRVRDLLGMASGIGEPPAVSSFHEGDPTAGELLRSIATLPVIAPPHKTFFYNNTVYAGGGYLPALAQGTADDALETVYAQLMHERVFRPAGMAHTYLTDDPRPFVTNYATGHAFDLTGGTAALPNAPVGAYAPVGGVMANLTDMASYITMQLNAGLGSGGERVVSSANLAACWEPHIDVPMSPAIDPDLAHAGYGMGWISQTYQDGRRLVWHNGGIDGFSTLIGFCPEENLGLVVLSNMGPLPRGLFFTSYVLNRLLTLRFGLNAGSDAAIIAQYRDMAQQLHDLAAQARPVSPDVVLPYLGFYEKGWRVALAGDGTVRLHQGSRAIPLLALASGDYVMATGQMPGTIVRFSQDESGLRWLEIQDIETVRWSNGPS
ncbi:MAG: beta-lactamase family protein [Thermomicrobiales bacterium]|nr:beta-lactamase family protein [Thermomicrobiales bacterium]